MEVRVMRVLQNGNLIKLHSITLTEFDYEVISNIIDSVRVLYRNDELDDIHLEFHGCF